MFWSPCGLKIAALRLPFGVTMSFAAYRHRTPLRDSCCKIIVSKIWFRSVASTSWFASHHGGVFCLVIACGDRAIASDTCCTISPSDSWFVSHGNKSEDLEVCETHCAFQFGGLGRTVCSDSHSERHVVDMPLLCENGKSLQKGGGIKKATRLTTRHPRKNSMNKMRY